MEKFNHNLPAHAMAMRRLPFSYFSLPIYLDDRAYVLERNGETIVAAMDDDAPNEAQALFVPERPENRRDIAVRFATKQERDGLAAGGRVLFERHATTEFFYRTDDFTHPTGAFAKKIRSFVAHRRFTVRHAYPRDAVASFYHEWKRQRPRESATIDESERSFFSTLDRLEEFDVRQVYVEIDGSLAGLAWGVEHGSGNWAGLHMKALYRERDLGRFLQHERAKLFAGHELFTLGTALSDAGVDRFKRELGPAEEREYFFLLLGDKDS